MDLDDTTLSPKTTKTKSLLSWLFTSRMALAMVGFLGFVNLYALRVNLSVALVCMVNQTHGIQTDIKVNGSVFNAGVSWLDAEMCLRTNADNTIQSNNQSKVGEFNWTKEMQGVVLGSFFWGYLLTQIPGGWMAQRYGGKRVFGYSMLMAAVATVFSPGGARLSPYLFIVLRIINGMGQGVVFPSMHTIWSKWAPPLERSKLIGFTYAGAQIGNVVTMPVSALLCDFGFDGGWASVFYVFGMLGMVWFALWMIVVSDSPAKHPRISIEERTYIEKCLGTGTSEKTCRTPWLQFARSLPVWAIIVAHTCSNWGTYTLLTNIPTYMKEILKFDMASNGLFSAIPFIFFWVFINIAGILADFLRLRGWQTKYVRKLMLFIGTIFPAVLLVCTGFITCHTPVMAVAALSLAVGFSGFQYSGVMINHVDIAPEHAGVLFGISNTAATLSGILAPYVVGHITANSAQSEWQTIFYIAAGIYFIGAVFFCIFAEAEPQSWATLNATTQELVILSEVSSKELSKHIPTENV